MFLQCGVSLMSLRCRAACRANKSPGLSQILAVRGLPHCKAHYEHAKAAGAVIVDEYEVKDYGGAGYSCRDIEGHLWSFGSYDPWKPGAE